jgi:pullulanase
MNLLKRTFLLGIAVLSSLGMTFEIIPVKAEGTSTLIVNYYRFDGNYTDWDLWLWPHQPTAGNGGAYDFDGETGFGKILTLTLAGSPLEGSTSIGLIARKGEWVEKDVGIDRFVDLTNPNDNGEVTIYLVQNEPTIYYSLEDADISHKILSTSFTDENTIGFSTTKSVIAENVTLTADDIPLSKSNFTFSGSNGSFDISENVDLTKKYVLEVDFGDAEPATLNVGFDGIYNSDVFNDAYGFEGELGAIYSPTGTTFRLWAPISESVQLNLYAAGHTANQLNDQDVAGVDVPYATHDLVPYEKGTWQVIVSGDLEGVYYTFLVNNGSIAHEVVDPYAYSTGINGKRGMIVDFSKTNPADWETTERPNTMDHYTDAIIYELHVRDFTSHESWNGTEANRGKFLGLTERETTFEGESTGLDHMIDMGVTHVQFIPIFDHGIIDETRLNDPSYYGINDGIFNWGYMPENFNTLEGSYSTDPYDGYNRIEEFKTMVNTFHQNDLRVIMDVVYNHTGKSADSNFDLIMPGYYFRMNANGSFSNGSGTGNETASERFMFRKFMVDSLTFYAEEYRLDGFRFDLMKLHDVPTMNAIVDALHAIDPTIIILGEPWTGGTSPLPQSVAAFNATLDEMPGVAVFNDDTRDGIKGSVFSEGDKGFVQGNNFADSRVQLGITGGTMQPNLMFGSLPKGAWAIEPTQAINYVTAHDNNTLYDKLYLSTYETQAKITRMQRQANAMILLSQGVPFLHAGVEMLRTKPCAADSTTCDSARRFDHNSYKSPDSTNQIDWQWKIDNLETVNYYRSLIALRRMKSVFRLPTADLIEDHLFLIPDTISGFVSYFLYDSEDTMKTTYVLHNNGSTSRDIRLQPGTWNVIANTHAFGAQTANGFETLYTLTGGETITMPANETLVMYATERVTYVDYDDDDNTTPDGDNGATFIIVLISILVLAGIGGAAFVFMKKPVGNPSKPSIVTPVKPVVKNETPTKPKKLTTKTKKKASLSKPKVKKPKA